MLQFFSHWYKQYFSDQEAVLLVVLLTAGFTILVTMGSVLAPVLAAIVLSYLLQGLINTLKRWMPPLAAFLSTYMLFMASLVAFLFILVPLTWGQLERLVNEQLPRLLVEANVFLSMLPERYPDLVSPDAAKELSSYTTKAVTDVVQSVLSVSLSSFENVMGVLIFLVLVPLLVFFFLKDKDRLIAWAVSFLPPERPFISRVMTEMDMQISNYVRGKAIEILICGGVTYIGLVVMGVNYAALLGLLVGLSVVVPYIGAVVVTVPVAVVAYFQFGFSSDFMWVMVVYTIIQGLDGNVLVPLLFSEAVNMHPVAIITAVLVFGGFWGLWGVFFAIPLATLVKAVFTSWPRRELPPNSSEWLDVRGE
ncbi:MAG TPA: AI-2E family transporter [Dongiaceae bacterium]|nr:AI-2E family transporter [Dongiaceae bacterium]